MAARHFFYVTDDGRNEIKLDVVVGKAVVKLKQCKQIGNKVNFQKTESKQKLRKIDCAVNV